MGCTGWNYEAMLPYFKKLENCTVPKTDPKYRGVGGKLIHFNLCNRIPIAVTTGPVRITEVKDGAVNPVSRKFVEAAVEVCPHASCNPIVTQDPIAGWLSSERRLQRAVPGRRRYHSGWRWTSPVILSSLTSSILLCVRPAGQY